MRMPPVRRTYFLVRLKRRENLSTEALFVCATPLLAHAAPGVANTMDDVRWQLVHEACRSQAEERLLKHLRKTRAFLFAIGHSPDQRRSVYLVLEIDQT
jgi:hypothetical protein